MSGLTCGTTGKEYVVNDKEDLEFMLHAAKTAREVFDKRAVDGKIPAAEVVDAYLAVTKDAVEKGFRKQSEADDWMKNKDIFADIIKECDVNGDGFFDFEEFKSIGFKVEAKYIGNELKNFDLDGDGYVTREEADTVLERMRQANHPNVTRVLNMINIIFDNFDADGDGKISMEEWFKAYKEIKI